MPTVFLSQALEGERLIHGPRQAATARTARRWETLAGLYAASLEACGCRVERVVRPEIYQTAAARQVLGVHAGDWHLAVKPIEHVRPFHGLPNVFVCDWPYPELSSRMLGGFPFFNQMRMLRMADAVMCCTEFTAQTLRGAGLERVLTLPPAIHCQTRPTPVLPGQRFLCAAEAGPLGPIIEGFAQAAAQRPDLRLVVCGDGLDAAAGEPFVTRADRSELESLLGEADFFLCGAAASGLSLPLVQAMLAGVPLVTALSSGTASLLPEGAAVPIATRRDTVGADDEPIGRFMPLTCHPPTAEGVRDAVLAAAGLDAASRARLAALARESAERRFGTPAFAAGLVELGDLLTPGAA